MSIEPNYASRLMARYMRPAIMLDPVFPPGDAGSLNSYLGGRPRLSKVHDWPTTPSDVPLHFLAQIDCSELDFPTLLPASGVLYFFGRYDEDQLWDGPPEEDCRVIYDPDATGVTPFRSPPSKLSPAGGDYLLSGWNTFLAPGEVPPRYFPSWPVKMKRTATWPDYVEFPAPPVLPVQRAGLLSKLFKSKQAKTTQSLPVLDDRTYATALVEARKAEYRAHRELLDPFDWQKPFQPGRDILDRESEGVDSYPQIWGLVQKAMQAVLHDPAQLLGRELAADSLVLSQVRDWLNLSQSSDKFAAVPADEKLRFRSWVEGLGTEVLLNDGTRKSLWHGDKLVFESVVGLVRDLAGQKGKTNVLPDFMFEAVKDRFFEREENSAPSFHHLCGFSRSAQHGHGADRPEICLLNLYSCSYVGWTFGDAGYCSFWMYPDDLNSLDFSKVWVTLEGH